MRATTTASGEFSFSSHQQVVGCDAALSNRFGFDSKIGRDVMVALNCDIHIGAFAIDYYSRDELAHNEPQRATTSHNEQTAATTVVQHHG